MIDLATLNSEQRDAVKAIDGPLMILAGAGTGKTRVITFRLGHMLDRGIAASSIVALSFTNKAAREMKERVTSLVGARAKEAWLGTFHSFCLNLLRENARAAGLPLRFGLAGTSDQIDLVRRALEEKAWSSLYQAEQMHFEIGTAKNNLLSPEELSSASVMRLGIRDPAVLAEVYALYERQLALNHVIDFDDCIYRAVRLLRQSPEVRRKARLKWRYLMVDEYQDTNLAQLAVLEALASDGHDVCVVGDDDQSIYSWRGALFEILERFEKAFPKTRIVKLEQNYRCTGIILDAANAVIRNNPQRKDKTLWSAVQENNPIQIIPCEDDQAEARFVTEKVLSLMGGGAAPREIGVLYRANAQAKAIELGLREARIPYRQYGGQSFFERKEVKDFTCYVRLVLNRDDRLALLRVINTPQRGIGTRTLEKLDEAARASQMTPYELLVSNQYPPAQKPESPLAQFANLVVSLQEMARLAPDDYEALGEAIVRRTGLEAEIRQKTDDGAARDRKLANLRSLPKWLAGVAKQRLEENGYLSDEAMLDVLALDNERPEEKNHDGNHVSLMTIHSAKGLEFPAVFLVGVEEELLPHKNSIADPRAVCEERRLFYVAITRAKRRLYISHCHERASSYAKMGRNPSRFLKELPAACTSEDEGAQTKVSLEERKVDRAQKTALKLSELRQSLASGKI